MGRRTRTLLFAVLATLGVAGCVVPGSVTVFADQFDGSAVSGQWAVINRPGDASNQEAQCYRPANVAVSGGRLVITTKVDGACRGHRYTSGMVQWKSANFTFGTLEFRARFAGGTGTWPAVWMLGAGCQKSNITTPDNVGTCNWPNVGSEEIDVAEILGGTRTTVTQGMYTGGASSHCSATATDVSVNWHTYSLVWKPDSVTWKIDGRTTCTIRDDVPTTPMFVMINTAVGGSGGGSVDDSTLPQQTLVDYIRLTR